MNKFLTIKEVSKDYFGGKVSERLIYRLFTSGTLKGTRMGGKILIYEDELAAYLTSRENNPPQPTQAPKQKVKVDPDGFRFFKLS